MLANAYLPAIAAVFGGAVSLLLAIVLELPILRLIWRRPLVRLAGWVLLANLASAVAGMVPVDRNVGPGMTADPWEVAQHWPRAYAIHLGLLLTLTLVVEGVVYAVMNRRAVQRVPGRRLLGGILAGNVASYAVLAGLMLWRVSPDRSVHVLPDTAWLGPCDERVWFVEPGSHQLCSIRLDGADRRVEVAEPLGRFDIYFYDVSLYALLPDSRSMVFVSPDLEWRVAEAGATRSLGTRVQSHEEGLAACWEVSASLPAVLQALGLPTEADRPQVWSNIDDRTAHPVAMSDEVGAYRATTIIAGGGGSGFGLSVEGPHWKTEFKIPAGPAYLACTEPAILPDRKLVVFRCSAWIMVMDIASGRVGRLVQGDSIVAAAPVFDRRATLE